MKKGNVFYMELSRAIFDEEHKEMSRNARYLFVCLNELEQRYCPDKGRRWFLCSDQKLCDISGFSINTLKKTKAELKQYPDLIKISRGGWKYTDMDKGGKWQPCRYEILK